MDNFVIILAYLLVGMGLKRLSAFPEQTGTVLNLFVIYVSLPALVLLKVPALAFSSDLLVPILLPWLMVLLSAVAVLAAARVCRWQRGTTGCLLLLVPLGNTSFLGIPMVRAFFGEPAVSYAVLYDQLGSFLALATYGSLILALYGSGARPTLAGVAKKIAFFPPFLALILALCLRQVSFPAPALSLLKSLAATLVPVVMIAVGYQLTLRLNRPLLGQMGLGLLFKLVAAPLAALLLCRLAGLDGAAVKVSIFEAGMPPMVSAGALAILADLSPPLTAALVGGGIVLSFATLPLLYQLL